MCVCVRVCACALWRVCVCVCVVCVCVTRALEYVFHYIRSPNIGGYLRLIDFSNLTMSCSFARSKVCRGGISFYSLMAITAVCETLPQAIQRRSRARRGAHRAPLSASLGAGARTSDVGRHPGRKYAPVFVSCVVKAHSPALGYCGQDAVGAPCLDSRGSPSARLCMPLPRWRGGVVHHRDTIHSHSHNAVVVSCDNPATATPRDNAVFL